MIFLYALAAIALGFLIEFYVFQIVRMFGHLDWAEKYFGGGGSYTAWRLIGMIFIIGGFVAISQAL